MSFFHPQAGIFDQAIEQTLTICNSPPSHDLALNCLRTFCHVTTNLDMYSLRFLL